MSIEKLSPTVTGFTTDSTPRIAIIQNNNNSIQEQSEASRETENETQRK